MTSRDSTFDRRLKAAKARLHETGGSSLVDDPPGGRSKHNLMERGIPMANPSASASQRPLAFGRYIASEALLGPASSWRNGLRRLVFSTSRRRRTATRERTIHEPSSGS